MKDFEAKKGQLRNAIYEVMDLHTYDHDMHWCSICESPWPCMTLLAIKKHVDLPLLNPCTYTFAHTKHWCGYPMCRDA